MMSCKEATRLVSLSMDTSLPVGRRLGLRLHILICKGCARFERQLLSIRALLRRSGVASALLERRGEEALSEEARERIRNSLRGA